MKIIFSYHSYWFLYYKHILLEKGGILEIWCSWFCVAQQDRQLLKNYYYKCHLEFVSMACGNILLWYFILSLFIILFEGEDFD